VTGAGTGYLPGAPGTWASAGAAGVFVAIALASGRCEPCAWGAMLALAVAASGACAGLGAFAEAAFGRKDPRQCTADEWAGQAIALVGVPLGTAAWHVLAAAGVAFVAFRLFDILKPPPARRLERLRGGWGILCDDLVAGIYANAVAQLVLRLGPRI